MLFLLIVAGLLISDRASAYPEFIGYKYSSCLTCHYNSQGNGPLNDYGRAVFASELAGRLFSGNRTDEQLGEAAGFLGSAKTPWWLKPGVKSRYMMVQTNPGSAGTTRVIPMQADINAAILFRKDERLAFVGSLGYAPVPNRYAGVASPPEVKTLISREHYLRWQVSDPLWVYLGMMDKVYGLRTVNHTAYSRANTGLGMNDQTHGLMVHYLKSEYEITGHLFVGNMTQNADLRQKGFSLMGEYEYADASRVGLSFLRSSNAYVINQRMGFHIKKGYGHGSALLLEVGSIKNSPYTGEEKFGYYIFSEAMQRLVRGYHLFLGGQAYKDKLAGDVADSVKFSVGSLMFPMYRVEFRVELENTVQVRSEADVQPDSWALLAQVHLAF